MVQVKRFLGRGGINRLSRRIVSSLVVLVFLMLWKNQERFKFSHYPAGQDAVPQPAFLLECPVTKTGAVVK
jgi:hypothetical protein